MSNLDADRPGSGAREGDGRSIDGVLHIFQDGRWQPTCRAPGCENLTDRDICDDCDAWVSEQVAQLGGDRPRDALDDADDDDLERWLGDRD